jgi:NAD(P)-dependent dehydrogenase (short-subunit alcohol dehydrogenase family)
MVEQAIREFGKIDFLVNNAGLASECPAIDVTVEAWKDIIDVNLSGTFYCCQAVGRHMIERRSGSIVNISSISAIVANRGRRHVSYNVAKAGVTNLTKMLACEWSEYGLRVNGIAPGYTATEKIRPFLEDPGFGGEVMPWVPMHRPAEPEEIAPLAIFLVSPASSYMTGTTVVIDGGFVCW